MTTNMTDMSQCPSRPLPGKTIAKACVVAVVAVVSGCSDNVQAPKCERFVRICEWNDLTRDFDRDCRFEPHCADGGADAGEADAGTAWVLTPVNWPQNAVADNSIVDTFEANMGNPGTGWDSCQSPWSLERGPRSGTGDPAPHAGANYAIFGAGSVPVMKSPQNAQAFFYFPQMNLQNKGLWFFIHRLAGTSDNVQLDLYETLACLKSTPLGRYQLGGLLTGSGWVQACAPLPQGRTISEMGLDLAVVGTGNELIGLDGLKLGPACP